MAWEIVEEINWVRVRRKFAEGITVMSVVYATVMSETTNVCSAGRNFCTGVGFIDMDDGRRA